MIKEIDDNEYKRLSKLYNTEYFTNNEIMRIKSLLHNTFIIRNKAKKFDFTHSELDSSGIHDRIFTEDGNNYINRIYISKDSNDRIILYKREDEWFLVIYFKNYYGPLKKEFFLIDGFDSLIIFIKEKINND